LIVVKSREHNYKPYHLVFVAHQIQGTNCHIFIACDMLEHEHEYEPIIKSPKMLREFGNSVRKSILQVATTVEAKNTITNHTSRKN